MYPTDNVNVTERATTSQYNDLQRVSNKTVSRNTSPIKIKRASIAFSTKKSSLLKRRKIIARKSPKKLSVFKKEEN